MSNANVFKQRICKVLFVLILFTQIVIISHWRDEKGNYYIDEFLSMEYINNFTQTVDCVYIDATPNWSFNKWLTIDEFKNRLDGIVKYENDGCITVLRYMLSRSLYDGVVRLLLECIPIGMDISRLSFGLNCLLFTLIQAFIARFLLKLTNDYFIPLLGVLLSGCCGFMISLVMYLRFYILVVFLFYLSLFFLYKMWMAKNIKVFFTSELALVISSFFICNMQPLYIVFLGVLMITYIIGLFAIRKVKEGTIMCIQMVSGGILLVVYILLRYPFVIESTLKYLQGDYSSGEAHIIRILSSIQNLSILEFVSRLKSLKFGVWIFCYGSKWAMNLMLFVSLASILLCVCYWARRVLHPTEEDGYILVCTIGIALYYLFIILSGEQNIIRYAVFSITASFISAPYWIGKMVLCFSDMSIDEVWKKNLTGLMLGMVFVVAFSVAYNTNRKKTLMDLYSEEKQVISDLQDNYGDYDVMVIYAGPEINYYGPLYESVYYSKYGREIQCVLNGPTNATDLKDQFVLYTPLGEGEPVSEYFAGKGYAIKCIGKMHISEVFYIENKERESL